MAEPFKPDTPSDIPTVGTLESANPVDAETVETAVELWRDDPPQEEFTEILDAEQETEEETEEEA